MNVLGTVRQMMQCHIHLFISTNNGTDVTGLQTIFFRKVFNIWKRNHFISYHRHDVTEMITSQSRTVTISSWSQHSVRKWCSLQCWRLCRNQGTLEEYPALILFKAAALTHFPKAVIWSGCWNRNKARSWYIRFPNIQREFKPTEFPFLYPKNTIKALTSEITTILLKNSAIMVSGLWNRFPSA